MQGCLLTELVRCFRADLEAEERFALHNAVNEMQSKEGLTSTRLPSDEPHRLFLNESLDDVALRLGHTGKRFDIEQLRRDHRRRWRSCILCRLSVSRGLPLNGGIHHLGRSLQIIKLCSVLERCLPDHVLHALDRHRLPTQATRRAERVPLECNLSSVVGAARVGLRPFVPDVESLRITAELVMQCHPDLEPWAVGRGELLTDRLEQDALDRLCGNVEWRWRCAVDRVQRLQERRNRLRHGRETLPE